MVVGVDGSDASAAAVDWARDHALATGATVEVVSAWRAVPNGVGTFAYGFTDYSMFERGCQQAVDEQVARLSHAGVAASGVVAVGQPASALTLAAAGADVLVVGSRGVGGFDRLLLGSTSHQVLRHADCSVVIVHAEGTKSSISPSGDPG